MTRTPEPHVGNTDGVGTAAALMFPLGLALDSANNILYFSESAGQRIRKLDLTTLAVTFLAGSPIGAMGVSGNINGAGADARCASSIAPSWATHSRGVPALALYPRHSLPPPPAHAAPPPRLFRVQV
jgi:hypothetical protein